MNILVRLRNLISPPKPSIIGIVVGITETGISVSLLDGSGVMTCNPNPSYKLYDNVMVQGNNIIGAAQEVTEVLTFKV